MRGKRRQRQRAQSTTCGHGRLPDAHREAALTFAKPCHHRAPARSVDAAAQQPDSQQCERKRHDARRVGAARHHEACHRGKRGRRRQEAEQQHAPVTPTVGEQSPWQFADGDAEPQHAEHEAQPAVTDVIAVAQKNRRRRNARKSGRKARVRGKADAQHVPAVIAAHSRSLSHDRLQLYRLTAIVGLDDQSEKRENRMPSIG